MAIAAYVPPTPNYASKGIPPTPGLRDYARYFRLLASNPLDFFSELYFEESVVEGRLFGRPFLMLHEPDLIRDFLAGHNADYALGPFRRGVFEPVVRNGLIVAEGDNWRRQRHALTPVFTPRHINGFAVTMRDLAEQRADSIAQRAGTALLLDPELLDLTLDILLASLFADTGDLDTESLRDRIGYFLHHHAAPHPLDIVGAPKWLPRLGRGAAERLIGEVRAEIGAFADHRRALIARGETPPDDFLTLLVRAGQEDGTPFTNDEVIDNLLTFIGAGHETTSRALTWALYLLARYTEVQEEVAGEIAAADLDSIDPADWGTHLPLTGAVFKETLRLYPAATAIERVALRDHQLGQRALKEGTMVMTAPWVLHRHRKLWREPDRFDPTRFLGEAAGAISRYTYLPFGLGPRICIGASFATQEAIIVLASFLRRLSFSYPGDTEPRPTQRLTVQPTEPIEVRVVPRVLRSASP